MAKEKNKIKKTASVAKKLSEVNAVKPIELVEPVKVEEKSNLDFSALAENPDLEKELALKPDRYFEAVGRRKTAVARVRLFTRGEKQFLVNGKPYERYFTLAEDQQKATSSMRKMKCLDKFKITVMVRGGGRNAQAEAVRHGTARVLVDFNNNFKKRLRKVGYLTRDPRMRERKKFGLKRARKAPQWAKR